jgi:integrase
MAYIYTESGTWSARIRNTKLQAFKSGFHSRKEAETWVRNQEYEFRNRGNARGFGPERTSLGQAISDYAEKKLPFLKGAVQEVSRINKYLRAVNLPTFKAIELKTNRDADSKQQTLFKLETIPPKTPRKFARGVKTHREKQAQRSESSDKIRNNLARMMVADIQPFDLQELMDQMQRENYKPATLALERAMLREFFNHARRTWRWSQPALNPATDLRMPKVSNSRNRVLSKEEQVRLEKALRTCDNPYVATCVALLLETTMRKSELFLTATWRDFDPAKRILKLVTAKADARDVPLTKEAVELIQSLPRRNDDERIIPTTMDAVKKAWARALVRAGIEGLRMHDLRHTGATRMAIRLNGNIFLLQQITGHKTLSMLERYVNLTASDVVDAFDKTDPSPKPVTQELTEISVAMTNTSNVICFETMRNRKAG